jgi:hypothetical protein
MAWEMSFSHRACAGRFAPSSMSVDLLRNDSREAATVVAIETAPQQDAGPQSSGIIPVACVTEPRAGRATLFSGCGKRK